MLAYQECSKWAVLTATTASKSPEQFRVLILIRGDEPTVGCNNINTQDLAVN